MSIREFSSITQFLAHLALVETALKETQHAGLKRAAEIIEADAKQQIGEYQPAAGPFPAWAPLAESTNADRAAQGFPEDEPLLRTGELRDSISHAVHANEAAVGSTSDVMVYQELGTQHIPPRPVLGPAALKNREKIVDAIGRGVVHGIEYGTLGNMKNLPE